MAALIGFALVLACVAFLSWYTKWIMSTLQQDMGSKALAVFMLLVCAGVIKLFWFT